MYCQFCKRQINNKGSLKAHEMSCYVNPNKIKHKRSPNAGVKKGSKRINFTPWNKGLTKETNVKILNQGKLLSENYANGLIKRHQVPHSEETKKRLSEVAKGRKLGGYIQGSGRGKKGWYRGFFCDSSWELAYVIYCLDHGIDIKRNTEKRSYFWKETIKNYIPDFIVNNDIVEIKGYKTEQWEAKLKANPDVKVLYEKDLKPILDYVIINYGKDFIKFYE